jgi:hypothetical protein
MFGSNFCQKGNRQTRSLIMDNNVLSKNSIIEIF